MHERLLQMTELFRLIDSMSILMVVSVCCRVRKYIGAYTAALNGDVAALLFSAGIGENSALARALICEGLTNFGIKLDADANQKAVGVQADISGPGSKVRTCSTQLYCTLYKQRTQ